MRNQPLNLIATEIKSFSHYETVQLGIDISGSNQIESSRRKVSCTKPQRANVALGYKKCREKKY